MTKVNDRQVGFVQGTVVLMGDGSLKPIEKIRPGDYVMSFDVTSSRSELEPREVIDTINYVSRDVLEVRADDDSVLVAKGQLFLTPGADWTFAHETAFITDADGNARNFEVVKSIKGNHKIYDIIVDDNHSLVANGFRVHNGRHDDTSGPPSSGGSGSLNTSGGSLGPRGSTYTGGSNGSASTGGNGGSLGPRGTNYTGGGGGGRVGGGTFGFAGDNEGPSSYSSGGFGGGGGGRDNDRSFGNAVRSRISRLGRKKPAKPAPPPPPPPDPKVVAYAAYNALNETMGYICDIMVAYATSNYFTVRTASTTYTRYAEQLANDALANVNKSDINGYDKGTLVAYHVDILNTLENIRYAWSNPNETNVNITLLTRACLNVNSFVDRSLGVLNKYIGAEQTNIKYKLPGFNPPSKVYIPKVPENPKYVKTAANTWMTTLPSSIGTTVTPGTTGGLGASYTRTRVVRGFLYLFTPGEGWSKVGPADQYRDLS